MLRALWRRLGEPHAISPTTGIVAVALQVSGSLLTALVDYRDSLPAFLAARMLALAVLCGVLLLGWAALRLVRHRALRPWLTLATFALALTTGTLVFDSALVAIGLATEHVPARRLLIAAPGVLTGMIVTAVLVGAARDLAADTAALRRTLHRLDGLRRDAARRVAERREHLVATVSADLHARLAAVRRTDATAEVAHLQSVLDDELRPLSHRLAFQFAGDQPVDDEQPEPGGTRPGVVRLALTGNPFHPLAVSAWLAVLSVTFSVVVAGVHGLGICLLTVATNALALEAARRCWARLPERASVPARAIAAVAFFTPTWLCTAAVMTIGGVLDLTDPLLLAAWSLISGATTVWVALAICGNRHGRQVRDLLRQAEQDLRRDIAALNADHRMVQTAVARALHGPVHDAIAAGIPRLRAATSNRERRAALTAIIRRVDESIAALTEQQTMPLDIVAIIGEITELWSDTTAITLLADPGQLRLIARDPANSRTLVEVVREGCSNAVRHGDARRITIDIRVARDHRLVDLRIANDGHPLPVDAGRGLGTALLDDLCVTWMRRTEGFQVVLRARLPLTVDD